jgi:DNA/RNA-binding domain of Phe-tRNA-synthetase-like protein
MTVPEILSSEPHPLLRFAAFVTEFPEPLGGMEPPGWLTELLGLEVVDSPLTRDEAVRAAVRDMLRHGGYKPTGRGKPASEYLVRAAETGVLGSINLAVDACNAVSLHSGLPISVVDLAASRPPYRIATAAAGERYVFNPAGQAIDVSGLVCLFDADGPCGNAVKDAQRTKTHAGTRRTLSVIWSAAGHDDRLRAAERWYRELLERAGAVTEGVIVRECMERG